MLYVFGPNSTPQAREYYNNDRRPLTEKQTQTVKQAAKIGIPIEKGYNYTILKREIDGIDRKLNALAKSKEMTPQEKLKEAKGLLERKKELEKQLQTLIE